MSKSKKPNKVLMHYLCKRYINRTTGEVEVEYVNVGGRWYGFRRGFSGRYTTLEFIGCKFAPSVSWAAVNRAYPNCKVTQFIVRL